jgi:tripartite-type tricarboxylate transporter receptor subunit TctC
VTNSHGVLVPSGTAPEIVTRLHRELVRIIAVAEIRDHPAAMALEPVGSTPTQFAAEIRADLAHWAGIVDAGAAPPR